MIQISDKSKCCGCEACIQVCPKKCIDLSESLEGFNYPQVNTGSCVNCGLCEKVCPMLNSKKHRIPIKVIAANCIDTSIRELSSSGGIFSLIAQYVISKNGIVFGVKFDSQWNAIHSYTDSFDGIKEFRTSKYVQSRIGDSFQQVKTFLRENRLVLFSGTPCQIAGLYGYLRKDYDNLITVDFVCHGVPSPGVWHDYLKEICQNGNENLKALSSISFRNKDDGWENFSLDIRVNRNFSEVRENCDNNNQCFLHENLHENVYMRSFLENLILRDSCFKCPFKKGSSQADITIADYWGVQHYHPSLYDTKGTSLVMSYTNKGLSVINELNVIQEMSTITNAVKYNTAIVSSHLPHPNRKLFFRKYAVLREDSIIFLMETSLKLNKLQELLLKLQQKQFKIVHRLQKFL